jgi:hypothetical protein
MEYLRRKGKKITINSLASTELEDRGEEGRMEKK